MNSSVHGGRVAKHKSYEEKTGFSLILDIGKTSLHWV
jgi:hypothetical protein